MATKKKTYEEFKAALLSGGDIAPTSTHKSIAEKIDIYQAQQAAEAEKNAGLLKGSDLWGDGYQFGDVTGTILGTVGDIGLGVVQGAANVVEGVADLGIHGVGAVGGMFGAKDFAADMKDLANANSVDDMVGTWKQETGIEGASVLGGFGDSLAQGVGQVGTMILTGGTAQALGAGSGAVTAVTHGTMAASSLGSGISEAYAGGATDAEAWTYGLIKAGVDTLSEMFAGGLGKGLNVVGVGKGLGGVDDMIARKISSKITNQVGKAMAEFGIKATAEGVEEVLAGVGTALAKKATYLSEEELGKLVEDEKLLEQFISGAVVSAIAQVPDVARAAKSGRSLVSNTTKNEDAVVNKEYERLVSEAENNGKKLSGFDKSKLYDKALSNMDRGRISIDTIESALGGEDYKAYSKYVNAEERLKRSAQKLRSEYDELMKVKAGELTGEQTERIKTLRDRLKHHDKQLAKVRNSTERKALKETLSNNVAKLAKDSRFAESYAEVARRGVRFKIDPKKLNSYSNAKKKTYESAIAANFNDQNAVHDIVDAAANIAEKTGVPVVFKNTDGLAKLGFTVGSGKTLNGVYSDGKVYVNYESRRALNTIVGHEITHSLEGTEHYQKLQDALFKYAKSKKDFDGRRASLEEAYKGKEGVNIDEELAADLVGDYLFTDENFINHLVKTDHSIAKAVFEEIKHLLKLVMAGSDEERALEKAKHAFEKAFNEVSKNAKTNNTDTKKSGTKYSIGYHAGDLGKSESLGQQSGGRDTGHYGTGTYFVGDEAQISDSTYGKRPHYTVDFDKYNLYNPENAENAGKLHEFLKGVNYYYNRDPNLVSTDEEIESIKEAVDELSYDDLTNESLEEIINLVSKVAGKYKTNDALWSFLGDVSQGGDGTFYQGDHAMTMQEVVEAISDKDAAAYKLQQLLDDSYVLRPIWRYQDWNESVAEAAEMLGLTEAEARKIISDINAEIASAGYDYKSAYTADSASTRFMKALGYEGIDVRGIKGYDNTGYGSVIYDLKGEDADLKTNIGTAKYSVSDEKTLDKNAQVRYNNTKWASDIGLLNAGQMDNFYSRFSAITENLESAKNQITSSGEYMIPVSDIYDSSREGIQNVVVYAKGTLDNPVITAVIEIDADNETDLSEIRRFLYETERRGIKQETEGVFRRYDAADFGRNGTGQNGFRQGTGYSNRFGTERGTSSRKTKGTVSYRTTKEGFKQYDLTPNEATSDDGAFSISQKAKLSVSKNIDGKQYDVVDGVAVSTEVSKVMQSEEYKKPSDYMEKYSISTEPDWEKNYLANHHSEKDLEVVEAIRSFTDKMVQDDAVRGYVPNGDYKYSGMGPLRSNVEYIVTFDMDTSCPRTFQFLNFRDAIQRKAGRYLTYNESINLLELMRAYGQQIPCCYCYVENKRVLLSASYNNFFAYRDAVLNAKTDADAEKAMYGYSDKKGLPDASRKALERWRSDTSYNPSVTDVWTATNTARNSVLNYLDAQMEAGAIDANTAQTKLNRMVRSNFGIADKAAGAEIRGFVKDWAYDKLAGIPHIYSTENNTDVSMVDERALALNHEALAYAKSASSAKSVENYVPYTDQLKKISEKDRAYIIGMGGIRKHSSNDFRMDYVQDYFLFYADLAANEWTGHTYTKSADFAKIFACTKDRINMSVAFYEDADGTIRENIDEGASWKDVREIRKAYKNVGSMAMVTSDNQLSYALNADWIDMIIPFHASGLDKSVWYNLRMWNDYTTKQSERFYNADTMRQKLNDAGVVVPKGANASEVKALFEDTFSIKHVYGKNGEILKPHFFPGDTYVNGQLVPGHYNDVGTYFRLCEEYGVHPRFYGITVTDTNGQQIDVTEHPSYIKLIKETARTDSLQEEIEFNFGNYDEFLKMTPFEYAMQRLQEEANNGGFENTKADPYGVVEEFNKEYLGKDRPLGYLTDRAKKTRDILLEMSKESAAKQASVVEKASISNANETPQEYGNYAVYGKDVRVRDEASEDIAPIGFTPSSVEAIPNDQEDEIEGITSTDAPNDSADGEDIAHVNVGDKEIVNQKGSAFNKFRTHALDDQSVIEDLALETGNRELDAKANFIRTSEQRAQRLIGNGAEGVRALTDIRREVKKSGLMQEFYDYMHHMHNIDRMSLADKGLGENKAVFGDNVTADVSRAKVAEFESKHPQFKRWAREVYDFNNYLRKLLVEGGVISQETADLWAQIYPHYVPIRREGKKGNAVNVPLDSGRTGINAPIKAAKGGNSNIEDMFQTMAMRAEQTYRAIAKNRFGIELKNTLQSASKSGDVTLNEMIDVIGNDDGLVKKGENGSLPTFTVFENGKRVTFEITEDLYEALKPSSDLLSGTSKILNKASKLQRGLLTEYNLAFLVSNAIKDSQDVLMNSQHAAKTYAEYGTAVSELFSHTRGKDGKWIKEYLDNGGEGLTHFNPKTKTFEDSDASMFKKAVGYVPQKISQANNFIERIPRLAEYIASRKMGKSIEGAMLDAARVTTNFAAGGDVTRFANRNGFTFLNASVQGFNQFVRNFREAKRNGLKGGLTLAAKAVAAGLPLVLVNHLLWGDDDEYEELSDYVKDNYYIVGKYGDGNFVRIPKGRTLAVIQNAFEQMKDQITGDDEIDLARFGELVVNNIAPVNPLDNNVIAPIMQAASNKTWYGDDLVPQRLQDLPNAEQYDETTDELSKWLGETFNQSPYKINYLLDQYSGFVGDIALPMMTPKAEAGDSSLLGKIIAPIRDKFTTDSTLKNQNVTDFYDTVDELKKSANSMYSKDEDVLKYKYMSSINSEISDLYKKKRELQNSKLSDAEKYEEVRKVQREIDDIAKKALESYNNVSVNGIHAKVGDQQYKWNDSEKDPGWKKLDEKQVAIQNLFTSALGIDENQYWEYSTGLSDIKSDEDAYGDTISGSRKKKVLKYIGGLDIDLGAKLILYKNEYNGDNNYNEYIVIYLNSKDNLTYSDRLDILKQIGFEVSADGSKVYW